METKTREQTFAEQKKISFGQFLLELLNLVFLLPIAVFGNSLLMVLDTVDSSSNVLNAFVTFLMSRRLTKNNRFAYNYGMGKIEAIGSMVADLFIAIGLAGIVVSAVWQLFTPQKPEEVLWFGIGLKVINTAIDFAIFAAQRKVARQENSKLLDSGSALAKKNVIFDTITLAALVISLVFKDVNAVSYGVSALCLVLSLYLIFEAAKRLKKAVSDLLDRTVDEETQLKLVKLMAEFYQDYELFYGVKTRCSGETVFVDIQVSFGAEKTYGEIKAFLARADKRIREEIPGAAPAIVLTHTEGDGI